MTRRKFAIILISIAALCRHARAEFYEFTLRGEVTYSLFNPNPAVGDPCTIRYVADSRRDPATGHYMATAATICFPTVTFTTPGPAEVTAGVFTSGAGVVQYLDTGPNWGLNVVLWFPEGVITGELPLELPLGQATLTHFGLFPVFEERIFGNITSYTSREVPEPCSLSAAPVAFAVIGASRRLRRTSDGKPGQL
jgi:hypothetical protein